MPSVDVTYQPKMLSITFYLFGIVNLILLAMYYLSRRKYDYWKKKKVPFIKPLPIFGNFKEYILRRKYEGHIAQEICQSLPNEPYIGAFFGTEPMLLVQDPKLIKLITAKDFYYFNGRAISNYTHKETFTQSLFFTHGDKWKVMRQNLTPLFSSAKMKNMFYIINDCATTLNSLIEKEIRSAPEIEIRSLMTRYTMDCIGSCAFGVNTDTMSKDVNSNPFYVFGCKIFEVSLTRDFKAIARVMWPAIFYGVGLKTFPLELNRFFKNLLVGVFESRQYTPTTRHDFVDMVLNLKKNKYISGDSIHNIKTHANKRIDLEVNDDLLIGQCIGMFGAGFETSATSLSFTLYELAKNWEAQKRAIAEVDEYLRKHEGRLEYDCVTETPYLDACITEALRLYPVLGILTREVMDNYTFPDGLLLEKGVRVHIPVYHIHHSAEFFPDPEAYRPERFMAGEKENIQPYTFLSFGEGARVCIGMRFAKMQMLPGLITILSRYRVSLAEGTPTSLPLEPAALVTQPRGGIRLKICPREDQRGN